MALCLTANTCGVDAFLAFGLRWPQNQHSAASRERQSRSASAQVIDVEAVPLGSTSTGQSAPHAIPLAAQSVPSSASNLTQVPGQVITQRPVALPEAPEAHVTAYARPVHHGQAPRLLRATPPLGQRLEAWA